MEPPPCTIAVADDIATITLDRPANGNALTAEMVDAVTEAFGAATDRGARCVVMRGAGRHFCTGGDLGTIAGMAARSGAARAVAMDAMIRAAEPMVLALVALPVPLVVACRGTTAGGGLAFVLAADLVVADETASFRFSHLAIGVPPDAGVSWLLPRVVGRRRAFALVADRAVLDARGAVDAGIVTRTCPADTLWADATATAGDLARLPGGALRAAKRLLAGECGSLAAQLDAEREAVVEAVSSDGFADAVRALLSDRESARG